MISLRIEDMKDFTTKLLIGTTFDEYLLSKATIATGTTVTLDGRLNKSYFDKDALVETNEAGNSRESDKKKTPYTRKYAYWKECKDLAFSRIKGKRLPLSFQFVMAANNDKTVQLCQESKGLSPDQIAGLFLNIQYDGTTITCVTGVSLHTFSLDKTVAHLWDAAVLEFFKDNQIAVTKFCVF